MERFTGINNEMIGNLVYTVIPYKTFKEKNKDY